MHSILIKNGKIWDGERFFVGDVLLREGRVEAISKQINASASFVYDAQGQIVSAGLIDSHVHIRGLSNATTGVRLAAFAPFGVTSAVEAWAEQLADGALGGYERNVLAFAGLCVRDNRIDTAHTEKVLPLLKDCAIGVKLCYDTDGCDVRDITPVKQAVAYAQEKGLKLMVHCNRSPVPMDEIVQELRQGDVLTHPYHGGKHSAREDDFACLRHAKEKGVILDAGFAGHIHTDFGVYREAVEKGYLPDTISTDLTLFSAFKRGGRYGMTAMMSLARECGQSEESIFKAVTSTPANVFGKGDAWGHLQEGRIADVAVFSYENEPFALTDASGNRVAWQQGYRCKMSIQGGEIIWKD